jgi:hypothetical protein
MVNGFSMSILKIQRFSSGLWSFSIIFHDFPISKDYFWGIPRSPFQTMWPRAQATAPNAAGPPNEMAEEPKHPNIDFIYAWVTETLWFYMSWLVVSENWDDETVIQWFSPVGYNYPNYPHPTVSRQPRNGHGMRRSRPPKQRRRRNMRPNRRVPWNP